MLISEGLLQINKAKKKKKNIKTIMHIAVMNIYLFIFVLYCSREDLRGKHSKFNLLLFKK